jgi:hypothetical protein
MLTTFTSYGKLDRLQQRDILKSLWQSGADTRSDLEALLRTLLLRGMPVG